MVLSTLEGEAGYGEIEAYVAELSAVGAISYGKLFDSRRGRGKLTDADLIRYAGMAAAYRTMSPLGPLALVVDPKTERVDNILRRLAVVPRPFKIFYDIEEARHWLEQVTPV